MSKTVLEGGCTYLKTVTDVCRKNRGDAGVINEILATLAQTLETTFRQVNTGDGFRVHVGVSIERPAIDPKLDAQIAAALDCSEAADPYRDESLFDECADTPIPPGVYYSDGNFYNMVTRRGMGVEFHHRWSWRAAEFPTIPGQEEDDGRNYDWQNNVNC